MMLVVHQFTAPSGDRRRGASHSNFSLDFFHHVGGNGHRSDRSERSERPPSSSSAVSDESLSASADGRADLDEELRAAEEEFAARLRAAEEETAQVVEEE